MKALTRLVGPVPSQDHPIELCFLRLSNWVPSAARQARATLWHPLVTRVGNNVQQFSDAFTPDRRDNA